MKAKYKKLSERYQKLEQDVHNALREVIQKSKIESKHIQDKVIKVNVFDYTELGIINNKLTFLNSDGYHYSIYNECSLEDLIDILTSL
jgi:hypothetical protein